MGENIYHLLGFLPATEAWEMPPTLEALAQTLVRSGKLRINADQQRNFVQYGTANSDQTFSARELNDFALSAATRARVERLVAPALGEQGLQTVWDYLRNELKKARGIEAEKELKIARVLVQSAHTAVIELLLKSGTEIYVSYAHNVADLMEVHAWAGHGTASGLQATERDATAVYVSAGGDPFFEGSHKTYVTDGFPALARMVVIAGQELGHFADLRRDAQGITGRYSCDNRAASLRADATARAARLADMARVTELATAYRKAGLGALRRFEKSVAFYHRRLRYSPPWMIYQLLRLMAWVWVIHRCRRQSLVTRFSLFPYHRLGEAIEAYLADMAFNLAPNAEVYRDPNPEVEEAIAVIEAVARVPQQVHKWGDAAVMAAWPGLYRFYFGTIIPACCAALGQVGPSLPATLSVRQQLMMSIRRRWRAKPGYYP